MNNLALIEACRKIGSRSPVWSQATAGNASFKDGHEILCRAANARFDSVTVEKGLSRLKLTEFRERIASLYMVPGSAEETYLKLIDETTIRAQGLEAPSTTIGLHSVLSERWVVHFPSLAAILMAHRCEKNSEELEQWVSKYWRAGIVFIDDPRPGWELAKTLAEVDEGQAAFVIRNFGVILQGEDDVCGSDGFLEEWAALEKKFCQNFGYNQVLTLCASATPLESAREITKENGAMPLPIYTHETASHLERLLNVLTPGEDNATYSLDEDAWNTDLDACELWLAAQILLVTEPNLDELPPEISSKIVRVASQSVS